MEYLIVINNKATPKRGWEYLTISALREPTLGQSVLLSTWCDKYEFVNYDSLEILKKELKKNGMDNDYVFKVDGDTPTLILVP